MSAVPANDERLACWIGFSHTPGIGSVRLSRLVAAFGDVVAAWRAPARALGALLDPGSTEAILRARRELDLPSILARLDAMGARTLTLDMDAYPEQLRHIAGPPCVLYAFGDTGLLPRPAVAVVGTRYPTQYGLRVVQAVAAGVAGAGLGVISGLAVGIDAAAHRSCLDAGGGTIAVLGSGLDCPYPRRNLALRRQIERAGAIVSEFPPGTAPHRGHFPARNRIVSGLAIATVVIEAGARSGALNTAAHAAEQGRDVLAVPGSVYSPKSVGTNRLIADGAGVVTGVSELLRTLGFEAMPGDTAPPSVPANAAEAALLGSLEAEPRHIDELAEAVGLPSDEAAIALTYMELKGMARNVGRMRWVAGR